ncbi:serine/threonine-protein kinase [Myxococcota bacterium]
MCPQVRSDIVFGARIGKGRFGDVHRATLRPHGDVAVKIVNAASVSHLPGASWHELKAYMMAEADSLRRAEHENVVRVFSVHHDEDKDEVYIAIELCDCCLQSKLENGPLSLAGAKGIVRHCLAGLEALHLRGMVHRDIKPGNILIKGSVSKLSDFGLVSDRIICGYASGQGYLLHLAPEFFDLDLTSKKTDVWAMGVTIFRILNGEPWFDELQNKWGIDWNDPSASDMVEDVVTSGRFASRLRWMPHVPFSWRKFVGKALRYDSSKRFQDGGDMLSALSRAALPDQPSWNCVFGSSTIRWRRQRRGRKATVIWKRISARRHEVEAYSEPVGNNGRKRALIRPTGEIGSLAAKGILQDFFGVRNI